MAATLKTAKKRIASSRTKPKAKVKVKAAASTTRSGAARRATKTTKVAKTVKARTPKARTTKARVAKTIKSPRARKSSIKGSK